MRSRNGRGVKASGLARGKFLRAEIYIRILRRRIGSASLKSRRGTGGREGEGEGEECGNTAEYDDAIIIRRTVLRQRKLKIKPSISRRSPRISSPRYIPDFGDSSRGRILSRDAGK